MFSEVVKLTPQVDSGALNKMFGTLNQRFGQVARKFGDGMKNALKLGGVVGIATAVLSKLLNPLERAEELINRIADKGDNAVTDAEEFNSDAGKLLRLEGVATAHGVDSATLHQLIQKFQGALSKEQDAAAAPERLQKKLAAESDPKQRKVIEAQLIQAKAQAAQGGVLHEFLDEKDIVSGFFKFVQSLQKVDPAQRVEVQSQVFGERVRGKASEFFNATDFQAILDKLPSAPVLKTAAEKAGKVADTRDLLTAVRESQDFVSKSKLVDESQVQAIDKSERLKNKADDQTLQRFDASKNASIAIQELTSKFDAFATDFVNNVAPKLVDGVNIVSKVAAEFLPSFKEVKDVLTGGFDKMVEGISNLTLGVQAIWEKGGDVISGAIDRVSSIVDDVSDIWAEFKTSKIYRTFGGG